MGYATFANLPKSLTKSSDIGDGQVGLNHLDPALYAEIRKVALHNHGGVNSRRIEISNLTGHFPARGFVMYSSDATKKYQVTIDSSLNAFVLTII